MKKIFSLFSSTVSLFNLTVMSLVGLALFALPTFAFADSVSANFESPFILGSISGQQGWGGDGIPVNGFLFDNLTMSSGPIPTPPPSTVTVTIDKFIDGHMATADATSANGNSFPMASTWSATNIGSGSGTYALGPTGFNSAN